MFFRRLFKVLLAAVFATAFSSLFADDTGPDYNKQIAPIFRKYCNGCHNADDAEGKLSLEKYADLLKGGENGAILTPGDFDNSRLILMLEGKAEPAMPPEDNAAPTKQEIALLKAWIKAGAKGPAAEDFRLITPQVALQGKVKLPIRAAAYSPNGKIIAVARHGVVELRSANDERVLKTLAGHVGHINAIGFSPAWRNVVCR